MTVAEAVLRLNHQPTRQAKAEALNSLLRQTHRTKPDKQDLAWNASLTTALREQGVWPGNIDTGGNK